MSADAFLKLAAVFRWQFHSESAFHAEQLSAQDSRSICCAKIF